MRILFLSHLLPFPLDTGAKIRAHYVLKHLVGAGHEVSLCAFSRPTDRRDHVEQLRPLCAEIHLVPIERSWRRDAAAALRSALTGSSFVMDRDWMETMRSRVVSLVDGSPGFDVIHADQLTMAPYAVAARHACGTDHSPMLVLDEHNAVFNVVRRLAACEVGPLRRRFLEWEADKLARCEARLCAEFDHVIWVAGHDRAVLNEHPRATHCPGEAPSTVIPISVDPELDSWIPRSRDAHRVVLLGTLNWPPNRQGVFRFLERAWPRIREAMPQACLTVIGRDPPRALLKESRHRPDLDVAGHVPDLMPYLRETAVLAVPLDAGGGMRVKILNAWCWGIPIVSTSIGAEGLRGRHGENLLIADATESFSNDVVTLLRDAEQGENLARAGRRTVEEHYDYRVTYLAWSDVYADLARRRGAAR
jgi:glycosyltransferase involved in cell wall biosynthesis